MQVRGNFVGNFFIATGTPYQRTYFDGQGDGPIQKEGLFVPSDPPNSCEYVLWPKSPVEIAVFQQAYYTYWSTFAAMAAVRFWTC